MAPNPRIQEKLKNLPEQPGVYLMHDADGAIIYVGKAISLKNRVRQYFQSSRGHSPKVQAMVEKIDDLEWILCDNELEALILENNLIKEHKPHYNILLKDDKTYPYVRIDPNAPFPRVEVVRRIADDGAKYFGPFLSASRLRDVLEVSKRLFPLRTCRKDLSRVPLKERPCLNKHIGRCVGPCTGQVDPEVYGRLVAQVLDFFSGKHEALVADLTEQMNRAAGELDFEKAAQMRDAIEDVRRIAEGQKAVSTGMEDQDIIALAKGVGVALAMVFFVRGGKMLGREQYTLDVQGDESMGEIAESFLAQYYAMMREIPREILINTALDTQAIEQMLTDAKGARVYIRTPQRGGKHHLMLLAEKNAAEAVKMHELKLQREYERTGGAVRALGEILGIDPPERIECYDISNTQGAQSVASMVVTLGGRAARSEYRRFRIKTVVGANDFASMREVVGRRFDHAKREPEGNFGRLPNLVVIDGGPEQLKNAHEAMIDAGFGHIPVISLAKKFEEIYRPDRPDPIRLKHDNPALHLLQRIRDESHRFAITYHRSLRSKRGLHSTLEDIPGIGKARRQALLSQFRTLKAIAAASEEELAQAPGMNQAAARAVYAHFHPLGESD